MNGTIWKGRAVGRAMTVVVAATCLLVTTAVAETQGTWRVYVGGEIGFPVSPEVLTTGYYPAGFGGGGGVGWRVTHRVEFVAMFNYTWLRLSNGGYLRVAPEYGAASLDGGDVTLVFVSGATKVYLWGSEGGSRELYCMTSIGYFRSGVREIDVRGGPLDLTTTPGHGENALGVAVGLGFQRKLTEVVSAFVEIHAQTGFTQQDATLHIPMRVGLSLLAGGE